MFRVAGRGESFKQGIHNPDNRTPAQTSVCTLARVIDVQDEACLPFCCRVKLNCMLQLRCVLVD